MILIIGDDIAFCASLSLLMKKEGFAASTVNTPTEAMDFLSQNETALVLLDMNFSNEGFDTLGFVSAV